MLFEHGFYLKKSNLGPDLYAGCYTGKRSTVTDHFIDAFVGETLHVYI